MTDVDGVSSRHSNFNRNRNIFPPRLVFSFRFVLPYFLLFSQGREKKRERERDEGKIGNHSAATWPYNGEKSPIAPLTTRNFNTPGLPVLRRLGQAFEAIDD